jgi:tRNA pseudouridine55 synthase
MTSFDVVAVARRRLGVRRVGHAGTLDPAAVGVLPLLIGEATKLTPYLTSQDKEYAVTVRFGLTTDTQDIGGRVLSETAVPSFTRDDVERACRPFVGLITQTPPMYSAVHHGGRRLYELARQGMEVEREPRRVTIHAIDVEGVEPPRARLRVVCGKGTYVRVLAEDLGRALGWGGVVEQLARSRVGPFERAAAVPWAAVTGEPAEALWARVLPPDAALGGWAIVRLGAVAARGFTHGQAVEASRDVPGDSLVRVHDTTGTLIGIGEFAGGRLRPVRILHADRPGTRVLPA